MARKKTAETPMERLHREFVTPHKNDENELIVPSLRRLARRFGVPYADARQEDALECWELELKANNARRWYESHGMGARSVEEFAGLHAANTNAHLLFEGSAEGRELAFAFGREIWLRVMPPVAEWEAHVALQKARQKHNIWQEQDAADRREFQAWRARKVAERGARRAA
jgi:hypothetical protein